MPLRSNDVLTAGVSGATRATLTVLGRNTIGPTPRKFVRVMAGAFPLSIPNRNMISSGASSRVRSQVVILIVDSGLTAPTRRWKGCGFAPGMVIRRTALTGMMDIVMNMKIAQWSAPSTSLTI